MALWDKPEKPESSPTITPTTLLNNPAPPPSVVPVQAPIPQNSPVKAALKERTEMKESLIASGLTVEGKIIGKGHVRIAGKFKGDIQVDGDTHIDAEAKVEGQVKAGEVIVMGELHGNVDGARHVELKQGSTITGDIKAGTLTVASGARMRGNVDVGFEGGAKS
jgi:cytoskeletal protein CcmA (bactofilin family)